MCRQLPRPKPQGASHHDHAVATRGDGPAPDLQGLRDNSSWLPTRGIALIVLSLLAFSSEFTALAVTSTFAILLRMGGKSPPLCSHAAGAGSSCTCSVVAVTDRFSSWGWMLVNGVVTFALGVMTWRRWPNDSEWIIGVFVGIQRMVTGWSWVTLALAARSMPRQSI